MRERGDGWGEGGGRREGGERERERKGELSVACLTSQQHATVSLG